MLKRESEREREGKNRRRRLESLLISGSNKKAARWMAAPAESVAHSSGEERKGGGEAESASDTDLLSVEPVRKREGRKGGEG